MDAQGLLLLLCATLRAFHTGSGQDAAGPPRAASGHSYLSMVERGVWGLERQASGSEASTLLMLGSPDLDFQKKASKTALR